MNRLQQIVFAVLLFPCFLESIRDSFIPFSIGPLSLGRFTFILAGILLIVGKRKLKMQRSNIFLGVLLILIANLLASFLSGNTSDIARTSANILLLIGARGCVDYYSTRIGSKAVNWFFILSVIYWVVYFFRTIIIGGKLAVYSELFYEGNAINHHVIGMLISVSSIFVAIRYFFFDGRLKVVGYLIIISASLICFITESRSNTIVTLMSIFILLFIERRVSIKLVSRLGFIVFILFYTFSFLTEQNDTLGQRFDISDMDYQERTTGVRFEMISLGIEEFFKNPLGKGFNNIEVLINGRTQLVHNQYLSFIIGGGVLGFIGVIIWWNGIWKSLNSLRKTQNWEGLDRSFITACVVSMTIFQITLFTIEFSSLFLYQIIAIGIYAETKLREQNNILNYISI